MTDSIRIGMVVPFTGPKALSVNGPRMHAGTAAWLARYNERAGHRGHPVELIVEDSGYDIAKTAAAIRKLAEEDVVVALLSTNGTPQLTAAMPYLQSHRVPLLLPFGGSEDWFQPPKWGVFGVQAPFNDCGHLLGQWAAREGHRRVVVLYPHYPEISPLMAEQAVCGFRKLRRGSAQIVKVRVQLGCEDGPAMADAVLEHDPNAIIVLVNWVELIAVTREIQQRGRAAALYSWSANVTQQVAELGGALFEDMKGYSSLLVGPKAGTPAVTIYREAMARFFPDQEPDIMSMTSFAHAMIFTAALDQLDGVVDRESLAAVFERLQGVETGILPPVGFSPTRHMGVREVQPMQVRRGIWEPIGIPEALPLQSI